MQCGHMSARQVAVFMGLVKRITSCLFFLTSSQEKHVYPLSCTDTTRPSWRIGDAVSGAKCRSVCHAEWLKGRRCRCCLKQKHPKASTTCSPAGAAVVAANLPKSEMYEAALAAACRPDSSPAIQADIITCNTNASDCDCTSLAACSWFTCHLEALHLPCCIQGQA